jgi:predicted PurR-regulated permease PerM
MLSPDEPEQQEPGDSAEEAMPLPADAAVMYLGGIFLILLLAAVYAAAEIVWPLVLAFLLSLLLKPLLRLLERLHIPRVLCALLLVAAVLGLVVGLGTAVSGPATTWAAKLPDGLPRLFQRLSFLEGLFTTLQHFWQQIERFAGWEQGGISSVGSTLLTRLFTGTRIFASGFFTTLLFLFFLLVAGDIFLQRLVEIMPRFSSKRQVVDISNRIERDISAYLLTITTVNAAVGSPLQGSCGLLESATPSFGARLPSC